MSTTPWLPGPPLLPLLRRWKGAAPCELPDEGDAPSGVRFAPGAWDGILGHHATGVDEQEEARLVGRLLSALYRLIRDEDDDARAALYSLVRGDTLVRHIDVILRELVEQQEVGPADVLPHARWLMSVASHRNALKFGIALVGICGEDDDLDDLRVLARHDEFTLYAAVASANLVDDPVEEWWSMAGQVKGWGRIHLVERLCHHVGERDDLRAWLLRGGCVNDVMNEYLALDCAVAGDLAGALATGEADDELLDGAGVILEGLLVVDGPAGDLDAYPDAVSAVEHYLRHMQTECRTLGRLHTVANLHRWLTDEDEDAWDRRADLGWNPLIRDDMLTLCREILAKESWPDRVRRAFLTDDVRRPLAWDLSLSLGIDLWDAGYAMLEEKPLDARLYAMLLQGDDPERAGRVVRFAEQRLPLAEVASGPNDSLGSKAAFAPHACVDALLTRMAAGDVYSESVVAAALWSPVVRNRHLAADVLAGREKGAWGRRVAAALAKLEQREKSPPLIERWRKMNEAA